MHLHESDLSILFKKDNLKIETKFTKSKSKIF